MTSGTFQRKVLALAPIIAALRFMGPATDDAVAGTLPKDPCALVTAGEIQGLASNAKIGNGVPAKDTAPLAASCTYSWGPRTDKWGESALTIAVIDGSKGWPGTSPDLIQQGVLLKVKTGGPNASQISGVGDAAVFTYEERSYNASVEAYFKGKNLHLSLVFHHGDSLQSKDKLIALLKIAAGRL